MKHFLTDIRFNKCLFDWKVVSSAESFDIVMKAHESGLSVSTKSEPRVTANVGLTSPLVREENQNEETAPAGM